MRSLAYALVLAAAVLLAPACALAASFQYQDWELACDNTRTCRAAGYQRIEDDNAVSVLLTRAAGPGASVLAEVTLGHYDEHPALPAAVTLTIDGRSHGAIALERDEGRGKLAGTQVAALLGALLGTADIRFVAAGTAWRLSGTGAAAVLLKMDEAQGRIGTPGALARKGAGSEAAVPPPLPRPVVRAAALAPARAGDERLAAAIRAHLRETANDDCADLKDTDTPGQVWRLAPGKVLFSTRCWMAAYNEATGFWVANDRPPFQPVLVTLQGTDFAATDSRIVAALKGRGLGDCFEIAEWVWDGGRFVPTAASSTGQCRLVAPGGAWSLPTLVSDVQPARTRQ